MDTSDPLRWTPQTPWSSGAGGHLRPPRWTPQTPYRGEHRGEHIEEKHRGGHRQIARNHKTARDQRQRQPQTFDSRDTTTHHHPTTRRTHHDHMGTRNHLRPLRPIWNAIIRTNNGWPCRHCNQPIHPGQPFDLGHPNDAAPHQAHTTHDVQPEHPHCNRSAGATAGNHLRAGRIEPSRNW